MSVGPLGGLIASVAGSPLAQLKGTDVERSQQETANHERRVQTDLKAESADLFSRAQISFEKATAERECLVKEDQELYEVRPAKRKRG